MKTLYVTDLDGTLLNKDGYISEASIEMIHNTIEQGALVTLATGRCLESTLQAIQTLNLNLPWVINNGAFVYCPLKQQRLSSHLLTEDLTKEILSFCQKQPYHAQVYTLDENNHACFYYSETYNKSIDLQVDFYRQHNTRKLFQNQTYSKALSESVISVELRHEKDSLLELKAYAENHLGLQTYFYPCYFSNNNYLLEIHNPLVSKGNAVDYLKNQLNIERIVCFGDELNDISMMEMADHGCAVENACSELKKIADEIIPHHDANSVAKYIAQDFAQKNR